MEQLIKTFDKEDGTVAVDGRDLHDGLQITRRFSLRVVDNFKDFEEGTDYEGVLKSTPFNPGCKLIPETTFKRGYNE